MITLKNGKITIICGPMFSGKTEELIRLVRRMQYANKECVVFKPRIDNRYNPKNICSHNGNEIECILIDKSIDIMDYLKENPKIQCIGIDEIQFLDDKICDVVSYLSEKGYNIIASGLDMDFRGEPFGVMPQLLCIAEEVYKLKAVCNVCGEDASYTQRLIDKKPVSYDNPILLVGEKGKYEARCKEHHIVKNKPIQKILIREMR